MNDTYERKKPTRKRWWFLAIFAFFLYIYVNGYMEEQAQEANAKKFGFENYEEQVEALDADCKTKKCYVKHLKDIKIKEEQEAKAAQKAKDAAEKEAADKAAAEKREIQEENEAKDRDNEIASAGMTRGDWKRLCETHAYAADICAISDTPRSCVREKIGNADEMMGEIYCQGATPWWAMMGAKD